MKQTDLGLDLSTRRTRKQILLEEMNQVMPWADLLSLIAPHAPVAKTGRPPFDLALMLRIHCLQQWFGLSGLVHTVIGTASNVNDVTQGHALLHGEEQVVFVDAGYQGASKRPQATGVDWNVAMRPGKRRGQKRTPWGALNEPAEKVKASVRAKVEHPFRVIQRQFGYVKVR